MSNLIRGIVTAATLVVAGPALATVYGFEEANPHGSSNAGTFTSVAGMYDDSTQQLMWSSSWKKKNGNLPDAFWMVLSDGGEAKGADNTYAVLYGSIDGGDSGKLAAYDYDGVNGPNSWMNRDFIGAFDNAITVNNDGDTRSMSFQIDATQINAFGAANGLGNWFGTGFGAEIGVWQHAFVGDVDFKGAGGRVSKLHIDGHRESWFDTAHQKTFVKPPVYVPEPATLALVGLGLVMLGGAARRRAA